MLIIDMVRYCYTSMMTVMNKTKQIKKLAIVLVLARMRTLCFSYTYDEI